jgi:hypothetical protein
LLAQFGEGATVTTTLSVIGSGTVKAERGEMLEGLANLHPLIPILSGQFLFPEQMGAGNGFELLRAE